MNHVVYAHYAGYIFGKNRSKGEIISIHKTVELAQKKLNRDKSGKAGHTESEYKRGEHAYTGY